MDSKNSERFEVAEIVEELLPAHDVFLPTVDPKPPEEGDGGVTILERMAGKLLGLPRSVSGDGGNPSGSNTQVHDRPSRGFD